MPYVRMRIGLVLGLVIAACSGSDRGDNVGAGGTSGGTPANGGSTALGGSNSAGGSDSAGTSGAAEVQGGAATGGTAANEAGAAGALHADAGAAGAGPITDPSAELYAPERLPRFDIELPAESVAALDALTSWADPKTDEYVPATLRYGDEVIENVGLRIKGESSFRKLDKKSAFKIKFDAFVPKQSFRGLRRLTLNNMSEDPSFMAERLAYELFRAANLPAPRANNALVYVNGEFYGVYANIEAEDKTFLARWFESNDGNLYEEGGKDFVPGAETAFDLETNETLNDRSGLVALIAGVQSADATNFSQSVGEKLRLSHFLRFTAAEAAVNQWDMYAYTMFFPNNFRIYEDPVDGRFVFLPWGMDMAMKPFRDSGRPHIPVFGIARQGDRDNGKITAGLVFRKCLENAECKSAYAQAVAEMADIYEQADLSQRAGAYYAQIREHVYLDPRKEYTNAAFESAYQSVLTTIEERPEKLRADLLAAP
ncbi:MAG: CotH kinase family protein [Myxococcota bacterium]